MSGASALQAALQARLVADAAVGAALGDPVRLWDGVPAEPVFPYAAWDRWEARPANADHAPGEAHTITLNVWSVWQGRAEVNAILAALADACLRPGLSVAGHRLILMNAVYADTLRTGRGRLMLGVLRLRARTEPV